MGSRFNQVILPFPVCLTLKDRSGTANPKVDRESQISGLIHHGYILLCNRISAYHHIAEVKRL